MRRGKVRDKYCADGVISDGERLVRLGGVVYFGGYRIHDHRLMEWVGRKVWVSVDDYYFTSVSISDADDYCKQVATGVPVNSRSTLSKKLHPC